MRDFKNILCYAGADEKDGAVLRAVKLAMENQASLTLMHVLKPPPITLGTLTGIADADELQRQAADEQRERLLGLASEYLDTGVPIDVVVATGDPATEIGRQVNEQGHDLVVHAAESLSPVRRLFGGFARSLLRVCPCPVWIVKPQTFGDFERVLAAVDVEAGDEARAQLSRSIVHLASSIAEEENSELHVVSAWKLWMEQSLRRRAGDADIDGAIAAHEQSIKSAVEDLLRAESRNIDNVHIHLRKGDPANVIRSVTEEVQADLLVIGTVCRTGAAGFLIGNTAETLLADLTCSVLALNPAGLVAPAEQSTSEQSTSEQSTSEQRDNPPGPKAGRKPSTRRTTV